MKQAGFLMAYMLFLVSMTVSGAFAAESPVNKGSVMVGGGGTFSSMSGKLYEDDNESVTLFLLYPSVSFFPTRGLSVGGQLLLGSISQDEWSLSVSGIGPKLTYYFGANKGSRHGKGRTYPYLTASVLFGQLSGYDGDDDKISGTLVSIGGGINYMAANSIGLTAEVNYRSDSLKDEHDNSESGHSINVMVGFSLFLWE